MQQFYATQRKRTDLWLYLVDYQWALQTTFAGAIGQQIGLDLIQSGQGSATGTTGRIVCVTREAHKHLI